MWVPHQNFLIVGCRERKTVKTLVLAIFIRLNFLILKCHNVYIRIFWNTFVTGGMFSTNCSKSKILFRTSYALYSPISYQTSVWWPSQNFLLHKCTIIIEVAQLCHFSAIYSIGSLNCENFAFKVWWSSDQKTLRYPLKKGRKLKTVCGNMFSGVKNTKTELVNFLMTKISRIKFYIIAFSKCRGMCISNMHIQGVPKNWNAVSFLTY